MYRVLSPSHRAVLTLANILLSGASPGDPRAVFADVSPEELARIAQKNHIHTAVGQVLLQHPDLQGALPRDLAIYFVEMYRANQERHTAARAQLHQIGAALAAEGIFGIVMKGGGDVLDPLHDDPAIRFSSDLDILVRTEDALRAEEILLALGAQSLRKEASEADEAVNWRGMKYTEHHLPKLVHEDWLLPVEIHMLAGRGVIDQVLPVSDLFARKVGTDIEGLSVMSAEDRACHLITHAHHHGGEMDLRAWIDWAALRKRSDRAVVQDRLACVGLGESFATFEAMVGHLEAGVSDPGDAIWRDATVKGALKNFGDTRARQRGYLIDLTRTKFKALMKSPQYRRYLWGKMMQPDWWKEVWATHKAKRRNQR